MELQEELSSLSDSTEVEKDVWTFIWGQQRFSSSKYYHYQFQNVQPERSVIWIWKTKCVPKIKFFGWLLLVDRLNTRNMLKRRKKFLQEGYHCVLCQDGVEEIAEHLFFQCTSAASRWFALGITWDEHSNIHQKLYLARNEFRQPFFMDIFLIGAWCLWNEGNNYIFKNKPPSIVAWKASVKYTVTSHLIRIKQCYHNSILLWLEAL